MTSQTCLPRETLKQYLSGAIDDAQTTSIEAHLSTCATCEQTIVQLESDPDTLLATVRELGNRTSQANSALADSPSVVQRAVATARRLPGPSMATGGPLVKLDQIGAYQLLELLGQGGMGQVFLARHTSLDKQVAIKLLFPRSQPAGQFDFVTRFQREMRAAGRLDHPSIVAATDAGEAQGTHYLVMEFIDGLDLSRIARAVGQLSIADACELMRQAAIGLSHAHAEGIVHRDVKPSNLMLDTRGRVKILDFGLAQSNLWGESTCELTTVGQLMGTLDYMAPEQAERSAGVDYRADLYALGATLFRLITGRAPLAASPNMTLLEKVRLLGSQSAPSLSSLRSDAPPALVALMASLLSRVPADRPASAAHVAEALMPFCEGHKLGELLQTARAQAEATIGARESINPATPSAALPQPAHSIPTPPRQWRRLLWGAAMLPLLALAGVLLTLELQKGQLVIQSDVADVQVKLLRDGKMVQELLIQPGAHATRLRADQYEIVIDAPSDRITVDKNKFSLRQGEVVVATIEQRPAPAQPSSDTTPHVGAPPSLSRFGEAATASSQTTEQTKPEQFLQTVDTCWKIVDSSRDEALLVQALKTLCDRLNENDSANATPRLLSAARRWTQDFPVEPIVRSASPRRPRAVDTEMDKYVFICLTKCNSSDSFSKLLNTQLLVGDKAWVARWLAVLIKMDTDSFRAPPYRHAQEILEHLLSDGFANGPLATFDGGTVSLWQECIKHRLVEQQRNAQIYSPVLVKRILAHPAMGRLSLLQLDPYFLSRRIPGPGFGFMAGAIVLEETIAEVAKQVLADSQATPEEYAHAAYRLATTGPFVERWRDELRSSLSVQLKLLASTDERPFTQLPMQLSVPENWSPIRTQSGEIWPASYDVHAERLNPDNRFRSVRYTNSETLAYLALVKRLRLTPELDQELAQLLARCIDAEKPLRELVAARNEFPPPVGGNFTKEALDALSPPWRDLPDSVWTAQLFTQALNNLANEVISDDSQLSRDLLVDNATVDMLLADRDHDGRLSADELKTVVVGIPVEDLNGDGSYDLDELLANRREYARTWSTKIAPESPFAPRK